MLMSWPARWLAELMAGGARRRRPDTQGAFYVGRRPGRTEVYVVTRRDVQRLRPHVAAGDVTFDWGPGADRGGAVLAFAILAHSARRDPPASAAVRFEADVVALLLHSGFVLGFDDIALWLAAEGCDPRHWNAPERTSLDAGTPRR
jgi:hypothetical protein